MSDNIRDYLQRFLFDGAAVRGEITHLNDSWQDVLSRHEYPPIVRNALGEAMAAMVLLSGTLKMEGILTLQIQGKGAINLLVVEIVMQQQGNELQRQIRGMAKWQSLPTSSSLADMFGDGMMVITLDPANEGERYQGIVELVGDNLASALQAYLKQSEQLDTQLWLASDEHSCSGLLVQRMPKSEEQDNEDWSRINQLAATVTEDELLQVDGRTLLYRLFHEETVRLFEAEPVRFHCNCSRERVSGMLRSLGEEELRDILAEQGKIETTCEYCLKRYVYDAVDVEQLINVGVEVESGDTRH
jgi:molecular chaperone Hsp33